jgi:perosamine synthetase
VVIALQVPISKPWFDDAEPLAAAEVVRSGWLFMGPLVRAFETQFASTLGVKHAIAVNSGSSALLVTLLALGIERGDEVLVPDMTFISTASCALFAAAIPRFVDIELNTYGMDPSDLERKITSRTRVIIPVHHAGHTAEMGPIMHVARRHGIRIVEDAAGAHLASYEGKYAGTIGHAGIFSFTPSKPMTVGEGGMIVTDDDVLAENARLIRNFGDTDKFSWVRLGYNFRMMDIQGAIGLCQLKKLAEAIRKRHVIAQLYNDAFGKIPGITTPHVRSPADTNFQLYTLRIDEKAASIGRDRFMKSLAQRGVASRVYCPALHRSPVFSQWEGTDEQFPNASVFADTAVCLPLFPTMTELEIDYVIHSVKEVIALSQEQQRPSRPMRGNVLESEPRVEGCGEST